MQIWRLRLVATLQDTTLLQGFPGVSDGKESTCNAGHLDSIPGLGRSPGGGHGNPLHHSCLENLSGWRGLAAYSPTGYKESDTAEHASSWAGDSVSTLASYGLMASFPWQEGVNFLLESKMPRYFQ